MSIVLMINEKFKEHIPPWSLFQYDPEKFSVFFERVLEICIEPVQMSSRSNINERAVLLIFLIHCFNSLEVDLVRNEVQKLTSLGIWINLQPTRLEKELKDFPKLKKYWTSLKKKDTKLPEASLQKSNKQRTFLFNLIKMFFTVIDNLSMEDLASIEYCEKFIEFMTDLICQPLTRRFFIVLLEDCHFVIRCLQSDLAKNESEGHLFSQLLERLKFYCGFEVDNHTGEPLTEHNMTTTHYNRITSLQLAAFKLFPGLKDFSLSTVAGVDRRDSLHKHFSALSNDVLHKIAAHLCLIPPLQEGQRGYDSSFLLEVLIALHERRPSQLESLNNSPLYPTETILWDESLVPNEHYVGEGCFALPKLNLQFLTLHDYLLRNFVLFQLESTYEIKEDIEDVVSRMKPWINPEGETNFAGWARMGQPINKFSIVEVSKY
jgi:intron-binding protein aquarius